MATITRKPQPIIFDGRGYTVKNAIVTHRPKYVTSSIPQVAVYATDADGDQATLLSASNLSVVASGHEGDAKTDVYDVSHIPVLGVWFVFSNAENIISIDDVSITLETELEAVANTS